MLNDFKIYNSKKLNIKMVLTITVLFLAISIFGVSHHELWLDESHHFLLGRDSISFLDLYKNSRYDGHPILWNYLIHIVTSFTSHPFSMQLLHVLISALAVFIFLKKAPFAFWLKIAFLLSYFMLYEYTIISRNYNLGILFLFLSCAVYSKRHTNFAQLSLYLALCCNTHSIFIIVAIAMMAILFLEQFQAQKPALLKLYWKGYFIFIIGLFVAYLQIIPKSDSTFFSQIDYTNHYEVYKSGLSLFKALFPIVDFTQTRYWNSFFIIENFTIPSIIIGILVWFLPLLLFNKKRNTLIFVYLTFIGFFLFEVITRRYGVRYNGLLFLTLIVGLWIANTQKEKRLIKKDLSKYNRYIMLAIMLIQVIGGTLAYALDIKKPFNRGKTVSEYILEKNIPLESIVTTCESASLSAYLGENLHHICYGKRQGFYLWNTDCSAIYSMTDKELISLAFSNKTNKKTLFLIGAEPFKTEGLLRIENNRYSIKSIENFTDSVTHNYYIYSIEKLMNNKIIIFNPKSANAKHRIPNSILQVGAAIQGKYDYVFVDGNLETDPWQTISNYFNTGEFKYFCSTVMPGPQLKQAIPFTKKIKEDYPDSVTIWGGYFASNQYKVSINSGYVDFIVNGPGDVTFPHLLDTLESGKLEELPNIMNLIYLEDDGTITRTKKEKLLEQDTLPDLPYKHLNSFYDLENYLSRTFLGSKTFSYHSSLGCPFTCSFCAVVPIYNGRWKAKSAQTVYNDVKYFKDNYGIDAIEFHDNNFFTSRKRVVEFSELIKDDGITWWGEGRIDTINKYSDDDLKLMKAAGCKMIFLGAETGNDEILKQMNKGGTQTGQGIKDFAARLYPIGIIPEFSFVLGMPADTPEQVMSQIEWDINFIKEIKEINPDAEIIIYLYSPVATEGSELYEQIQRAGFSFPKKLDDWLDPAWENFDLRKNPLTPWLTPKMVDRIMNFETVLNGYYPTASDFRIKGFKKKLIRSISKIRYKTGIYKYPYEIKVLHKIWKYRQPEIQGFYSE